MYLRSPGRLSAPAATSIVRESSCWRSSSPAPRSASRQRRPDERARERRRGDRRQHEHAPARPARPALDRRTRSRQRRGEVEVLHRQSASGDAAATLRATPSAPSAITSARSRSTTVGRNITRNHTATRGKLVLLDAYAACGPIGLAVRAERGSPPRRPREGAHQLAARPSAQPADATPGRARVSAADAAAARVSRSIRSSSSTRRPPPRSVLSPRPPAISRTRSAPASSAHT